MKQTQYELSELVRNTEGSLREIGEKLDISKGYVSMLKKARENGAAAVITYWRQGELPWALVRALAHLPKKEQIPILRDYITDSRGKTKGQQKAVLLAAMSTVRAARGIVPDPSLEAARKHARVLYQDDDCQIDGGKVVEVDDGYWVPARVWVEKQTRKDSKNDC